MAEAEKLLLSSDDYLEGERTSMTRHEFVAGRVYAMAGGTVNHETVAGNFRTEAGYGLKGKKCRPMGSDLLLKVPLGEFGEAFYYPDGMIVCRAMGGQDRFTQFPVVILEVLSDSTRRTDELRKLRDYFTLPSLKVYLLAEPDEPLIRVYRRAGDRFELSLLVGEEKILKLPEVGLEIPLREIYRDVEFSPEGESGVNSPVER
jgi:Uma2 family endonuclease